MESRIMTALRTLAAVAALSLVAGAASAQATATNTVALTVNQAAVLSIVPSVGTATATNPASNAITPFSGVNITTTWNQAVTATTALQIVGYFGSANALSGTSGNIPTANVRAQLNAPVTAASPNFTATVAGFGNAAQLLAPQNITATPNSQRTDALNIALDYSAGASPAAGTYTGTLNLVAVVQ
jgi:hypothetical protein